MMAASRRLLNLIRHAEPMTREQLTAVNAAKHTLPLDRGIDHALEKGWVQQSSDGLISISETGKHWIDIL